MPEDAKPYFYALAEALDIYHSIKGRPIPGEGIGTKEVKSFHELRQIRDLCMTPEGFSAAFRL